MTGKPKPRPKKKPASRAPRKPTARQLAIFLERLSEGYSIKGAASHAGHHRQRFYEIRAADADFAAAWDEAVEAGSDVLEDEARRRAVEGETIERYDRDGNLLSVERRYSDTLLMFLLNGRRPEKFKRHAQVEHTGAGGGPIEVMQLVEGARDRLVGKLAQVVDIDSRRGVEEAAS